MPPLPTRTSEDAPGHVGLVNTFWIRQVDLVISATDAPEHRQIWVHSCVDVELDAPGETSR